MTAINMILDQWDFCVVIGLHELRCRGQRRILLYYLDREKLPEDDVDGSSICIPRSRLR